MYENICWYRIRKKFVFFISNNKRDLHAYFPKNKQTTSSSSSPIPSTSINKPRTGKNTIYCFNNWIRQETSPGKLIITLTYINNDD